VTGVQTCALPISTASLSPPSLGGDKEAVATRCRSSNLPLAPSFIRRGKSKDVGVNFSPLRRGRLRGAVACRRHA